MLHTTLTYSLLFFEIILLILPLKISLLEIKTVRRKYVFPVDQFVRKPCLLLAKSHLKFKIYLLYDLTLMRFTR